jgi:hypothetical protein
MAYNSGLLDEVEPARVKHRLESLTRLIEQSPLGLDDPTETWQQQVRDWWAGTEHADEQTA